MATTSFCVICGEALPYRSSFGRGKSYPICKKPACLEMYLDLRNRNEQHDGFCNRCGKPMRIDFKNRYFKHGKASYCEKAPTIRKPPKTAETNVRKRVFSHKAEPKPKPRIYLKPWQDRESLFCDTEFLETEILHKKIRTGEECKDKS